MNRLVIVIGLALVALAGCGTSQSSAGGPTGTPTPNATSASPTAGPTLAADRASAILASVTIDAKDLAAAGTTAKLTKSQDSTSQPTPVCGWNREPRTVLTGKRSTFTIGTNVAHQDVAVFQQAVAPDVLAESRNDTARCSDSNDGPVKFDQHSVIDLPHFPGAADVYGYCDRGTGTKDKSVLFICHGELSSKDGYVVVDVWTASATLDSSKANLTQVAAVAAEKLGKSA